MTARPAKRRKLVVTSSNDDASSPTRSPSQTDGATPETLHWSPASPALATRTRARQKNGVRTSPDTVAPSTERKSPVKRGRKPAGNTSLHAFFHPVTMDQSPASSLAIGAPKTQKEKGEEEEDYIRDDSPDEVPDKAGNARFGGTKPKPPGQTIGVNGTVANSFLGASQRYRKTTAKSAPSPQRADTLEHETKPWVDQYRPMHVDELAVHKKKLSDVQTWLAGALGHGNRKRLLILKGPSGSAKTSTVALLSKVLDYDVLEWRNPPAAEFGADGFTSMSSQFEDFLGRGGKYGGLDVCTGDVESDEMGHPDPSSSDNTRKRVILLEEFPNTFTQSSTSLQAFRSSILRYLAAQSSQHGPFTGQGDQSVSMTPVVMIISETLLTTTSASADSFTAYRLLGPNILTHPHATVIEFNPIAKTILTKALELVIQKEARKSGRRKAPSSAVLDRLAEVGDIRSAIGSLEFLCIRGDEDGGWGGKVQFAKSKRGARETSSLTKMEGESLEMVTQREASLGLFHSVGKVVYNKRDEPGSALAQPPDHLNEHLRDGRSQVSVEDLIDETGADTRTFISGLHENYLLSCRGQTADDTLEHVGGCIEALSQSDLLCPSWAGGFSTGGFGGGFGRGAFQGAGADSLRQDEISFQIAVRGILFSLPSPVKRITPPPTVVRDSGIGSGRSKGDAYKMYYPVALKLWRRTEEIGSVLSSWITRLANGGGSLSPTAGTSAQSFTRPTTSSTIESWKTHRPVPHPTTTDPTTDHADPKEQTGTPLLAAGGAAARDEVLLDHLPYMAIIWRLKHISSHVLRDLEKVTAFTGVEAPGTTNAEADDDEDPSPGEQWATDPSVEAKSSPHHPRRGKVRGPGDGGAQPNGGFGFRAAAVAEKDLEKLVLSDDDIEDD
ncbi:MAG: Cell cycle checkpoint protein rad17 [Piccolia ochrophora]|nr:MAG: Cell cycle checkpoint protein rad17 [Piccolia ochrophora]